jgi:hypothetical protein
MIQQRLAKQFACLVGTFGGSKWMKNNWCNLPCWDCKDFQAMRRRVVVKSPDDRSFYWKIIVNRQKF